jgi:hypothetical protein
MHYIILQKDIIKHVSLNDLLTAVSQIKRIPKYKNAHTNLKIFVQLNSPYKTYIMIILKAKKATRFNFEQSPSVLSQ